MNNTPATSLLRAWTLSCLMVAAPGLIACDDDASSPDVVDDVTPDTPLDSGDVDVDPADVDTDVEPDVDVDPTDDTDTDPADDADADTDVNLDTGPPTPEVLLGAGLDLTLLSPGDTADLYAGIQGGHHIFGGFHARNLPETQNVEYAFILYDEQTPIGYFGYTENIPCDADGLCVIDRVTVIVNPSMDATLLAGTDARLEVVLYRGTDHELSTEIDITLACCQ